MKMIFDLYLEDEIYSDAITHDQQYLTIIKEIKSLKREMNRIVSTDQKTEFSILTQKLFDTYMNLSNLYRYYDFIEGFLKQNKKSLFSYLLNYRIWSLFIFLLFF